MQGEGAKNLYLSCAPPVFREGRAILRLAPMALPDIQTKTRFVAEFPINASPKILFPYLATASGLSQWFCDDVRYVEGQRLNFIWDNEDHYAEISGQRLNRAVRFVFLDDHRQPVADADFLEFTLDSSEVTDEVYLRWSTIRPARMPTSSRKCGKAWWASCEVQVGG